MSKIRWDIGPMVRCDIISYSGINYSGKRGQMRIFPTGSQQGAIDGEKLGSVLLRAPVGLRMTFIASAADDWEGEAWRSVEFSKQNSIQSSIAKRLRAIRIPDLDYLDHFDAKTTNPTGSTGYPHAPGLNEGEGWTYGRQIDGGLKGKIQVIRIERMGVTAPPPAIAKDLLAFAQRILSEDKGDLRSTVLEALVEQLVLAGMDEAPARDYAKKL